MKTFLVTGAAGGIGSALCRQLAQRGDQVIAVCRTSSAELDSTGVEVIANIDLTCDADLATLTAQLAGRRIDAAIINAGVLADERLGAIDASAAASIRHQFEINALAPLRVIDALIARLSAGAKIALITSRMGSIQDNSSGGYYGYRMSKAAMNAMGKSLAEDLRAQGIAVALLHPGFVRTRMTGGRGEISAEQAAQNLLARVDQLNLDSTGSFWHANGTALPW